MIILNLLFLILGFILLIKGADFFVEASSSLGLKLNIPQIVIGLTIVSIGTSLPELFINIIASLNQNNDIVLGNILGSNIFNILMILGFSSLIFPITASKNSTWKEIPFVVLVSVVLFLLANDQLFGATSSMISWVDGMLLFFVLIIFLGYLYYLSKTNPPKSTQTIQNLSWLKLIIFILFGISGLFVGGEIVVNSAIFLAHVLKISDKIISLTIISIGTGLPELVTSTLAAIKKNSALALGNIVGSCILNILLILGLSSLIYPITFSSTHYLPDFMMLIFSSFVLLATMFFDKRSLITRKEGALMLFSYILYLLYTVLYS